MYVNERGVDRSMPHPSPSLPLQPSPNVQISFSPQPSAAIKIKDESYSFHQESTKTISSPFSFRRSPLGEFKTQWQQKQKQNWRYRAAQNPGSEAHEK